MPGDDLLLNHFNNMVAKTFGAMAQQLREDALQDPNPRISEAANILEGLNRVKAMRESYTGLAPEQGGPTLAGSGDSVLQNLNAQYEALEKERHSHKDVITTAAQHLHDRLTREIAEAGGPTTAEGIQKKELQDFVGFLAGKEQQAAPQAQAAAASSTPDWMAALQAEIDEINRRATPPEAALSQTQEQRAEQQARSKIAKELRHQALSAPYAEHETFSHAASILEERNKLQKMHEVYQKTPLATGEDDPVFTLLSSQQRDLEAQEQVYQGIIGQAAQKVQKRLKEEGIPQEDSVFRCVQAYAQHQVAQDGFTPPPTPGRPTPEWMHEMKELIAGVEEQAAADSRPSTCGILREALTRPLTADSRPSSREEIQNAFLELIAHNGTKLPTIAEQPSLEAAAEMSKMADSVSPIRRRTTARYVDTSKEGMQRQPTMRLNSVGSSSGTPGRGPTAPLPSPTLTQQEVVA